ncbi:hypothetical protein Scep_001283 [Stephania cephalantha]|uniref:Uncharacterized protein n=1 Tax=Stephania cephalantha TaxID=152367 RepID=A0AAP0L7L5_9MAGN
MRSTFQRGPGARVGQNFLKACQKPPNPPLTPPLRDNRVLPLATKRNNLSNDLEKAIICTRTSPATTWRDTKKIITNWFKRPVQWKIRGDENALLICEDTAEKENMLQKNKVLLWRTKLPIIPMVPRRPLKIRQIPLPRRMAQS